jgi:hypothetical protein
LDIDSLLAIGTKKSDMARVRSHRRSKKKLNTTIVSPEGVVIAETDINYDSTDDEVEDIAERLEFSTDDRRKVRVPVDNIPQAVVDQALIPNDNLLGSSQLYAIAKPIRLNLLAKVNSIVPTGDSWGVLRFNQLLEHVFNRTKSMFNITKISSSETLDTQMIDSAIEYLAALQTNHGGRNLGRRA